MNIVCEICSVIINEGNVCRGCRKLFETMSATDYEFHLCLECEYCDKYNFPCRRCAKYTFEYLLGRGNGEWDDMSDEVVPMSDSEDDNYPLGFDQILDTLDRYNDNSIQDNSIDSTQDNNSTQDSIDNSTQDSTGPEIVETIRKKKRGYYSRYCSIQ